MARLGPAAKMRRVLEFLLGLRDDRVLGCLTEFGFTEQDREKGWDVLRALGLTQAVPTSLRLRMAHLAHWTPGGTAGFG